MALLIVLLFFFLAAAGFALFLIKRDRGESEPAGALWTAFGFGALGVVIASALEFFLVKDVFDGGTYPLGQIAVAAITIAIIEELAKALPLMIFIYRKRYFNEHTDGVLYFALAGLGFGLPENILYTLQLGPEVGFLRLIMTPLFHAATTALIGYALIKLRLDKASKGYLISMVATAIGLHALYDFGLLSRRPLLTLVALMVTLGLTASLFVLYFRARNIDETQGLSVVGNNSFCRTCGHPNPKHKLYCSQCGNRA